jgi:hydroxylamine reductase (hybrid-cluster protein)
MIDLTIDTGDIMKWAESMEERGHEFAAEVVKKAKRHSERRRQEGKLKFAKIRRRKTGIRRFAIQKAPDRAAELINKGAADHFKDIFRGK